MNPRAPRLHVVLGALVCVVLPAATWIDRSVGPAWSMYTGTASYRIRIAAIDGDGVRRTLAPTALAPMLTPAAAAYVAGSEQWRHGELPRLADSLDPFARLACNLGRPVVVDLRLEQRARFDGPIETHTAHVTCAP